jgi:hypothetical protein
LLTAPSVSYPQIEHAREILNLALDALNSHELPPGLRFADNVTAELQITDDLQQVRKDLKRKKLHLLLPADLKKAKSSPWLNCAENITSISALRVNCCRRNDQHSRSKSKPWVMILTDYS